MFGFVPYHDQYLGHLSYGAFKTLPVPLNTNDHSNKKIKFV